ncbi:tRNA lysidine(34) synthetase TilS [Enterobacteriaceae bacterium H20N1]|uniref:tRNA(Ile)-lysidine synthase n=1 Tax=Dryocola boscaweniae TaxID=2925397 RepID=A0A9X2W522_9ENTR|nr:tRNA lysidine(34) synthetase TilS [Dryocola boscaweniae]MCT4700885.1 tRNA lysidine(34) synthetase TilS [Dryocola boscaweniae]MCT4713579.1 tRNA lysidine(34) synthetase TilS [Dryocola boscaweniae]MCT4718246.1 tRNA lysidine(34) synthetase TilS [Dryocola boscaweniae]
MDLHPLLSLLHPHRNLLVAFSGGLDSTVLLHQLVTLRETIAPELQLRAMHVHHGISPNADEWVKHCERLCARWNVSLQVAYVHLTDDGKGIEAQARAARYQALAQELRPCEILLTAQHLDDQCETFLLALKRGSGPAGLAAMPASLDFSGTTLLRPLLGQSRERLEEWAKLHQLNWIEDESNQDDAYDRNFLRLRVVPVLQQRWPHFARSVARSAELCGEQEALLDELLAEQLAALMLEDGALRIAPLASLSETRRAALLRRWFAFHKAAMPSRAALQRVWDEVASSREDANPRLKFGDHEVRRFQGALYRVPSVSEQGDSVLHWAAPYAPLSLPAGLGTLKLTADGQAVRAPRHDEPVTIRFKAGGNHHIVGRDRGRSLKKIWQELQIPSWQRNITPLIFYGEQLITAPGIFVTREGQATDQSCWHIDWQKENEQ